MIDPFNVPNTISLFRPIFGGVVALLLLAGAPSNIQLALFFAVLCETSDLIDGLVARRLGQVTRLGEFLDPACDSLYHFFVFVGFLAAGWLPPWVILLVYVGEIVTPYLKTFALQSGAIPVPPILSKAKHLGHSLAQVVALGALTLDEIFKNAGGVTDLTVIVGVCWAIAVLGSSIEMMAGLYRLFRG